MGSHFRLNKDMYSAHSYEQEVLKYDGEGFIVLEV